jgi:hypothetical protein
VVSSGGQIETQAPVQVLALDESAVSMYSVLPDELTKIVPYLDDVAVVTVAPAAADVPDELDLAAEVVGFDDEPQADSPIPISAATAIVQTIAP